MQNGQASRQGEIKLLPAFGGFFYLLFSRSNKLLGIAIILLIFRLITIPTSSNIVNGLTDSIFRLESNLNLSVAPQTLLSEGSKRLREEEKQLAGQIKPPDKLPENLSYSRKLTVFATSYDKYCKGCNETTAIGMKAGYGVIAVDPKVIPLRSKVYVPGYGFAIAGDTGGKIKGNRIDLGFDNVKNGWWSARYVDIYILN